MLKIAENICKVYGKKVALENVNLTIPENAITGIVGSNGSGKTTLLEMLSGLRSVSSGRLGCRPDKTFRANLGVVLQDNEFYADAKVAELLSLFATFYPKSVDLQDLMKQTKIFDFRHQLYRNLSGGMRQRVNIAIALVNSPQMLILDEPTTGLDPLARRDLWKLIDNVSPTTTTLVSSHYMDEVERHCDYVVMLKDSRVVLQGDKDTILQKYKTGLENIYIQLNKE